MYSIAMEVPTFSQPILYSYFRSSASWRVRIALAYKGIQYEYKPVPLLEDKQKSTEYLELNPMGQVPSLIMDGATLTQSLPIIEYLEETYPDKPRLLPKDPLNRCKARQIAEMVNSGIQPIQNLGVLNHVAELTGSKDVKAEWGKHYIEKGLLAVEKFLGKTAGRYCVGDEVTIADIFLVPQLSNAKRFKVDMSQFPIINRIHADLVTLEQFQVADPLQQPDCPEDLKQK